MVQKNPNWYGWKMPLSKGSFCLFVKLSSSSCSCIASWRRSNNLTYLSLHPYVKSLPMVKYIEWRNLTLIVNLSQPFSFTPTLGQTRHKKNEVLLASENPITWFIFSIDSCSQLLHSISIKHHFLSRQRDPALFVYTQVSSLTTLTFTALVNISPFISWWERIKTFLYMILKKRNPLHRRSKLLAVQS